jgi:hypothetical protein
MTELKEKRKPGKLTQSETKKRNVMLEKLHDSGDFDRYVFVCAWFVAFL